MPTWSWPSPSASRTASVRSLFVRGVNGMCPAGSSLALADDVQDLAAGRVRADPQRVQGPAG